MNLYLADSFKRDYRRLSNTVQKTLDKQLLRLVVNMRHPSLRAKKMVGRRHVWEARISKGYRFTFQKSNGDVIIRRVGTHDILKNP